VALYKLYGLTIDSEFPLPGRVVTEGRPDLTVGWGPDRPIPEEAPRGRVVSEINVDEKKYTTAHTEDGYVIRFPGKCDAIVSDRLDAVELVVASPEDRSFGEILFSGGIMAKVLMLGGGCVLHASAVAAGDSAIAYVGPPGRGKSTLAALTCATGARLITDDVLRLVPREDGWQCSPGTGQLRLRRQAASLVPMLQGTAEETLDLRIGVSMDLSEGETRLAALVFPLPSRTATAPALTRLTEHDTLMQLTSFPRVLGWKDPQVLANSFRWNARLAREVPALQAEVPWGPPFDPSIARQLVELIQERSREPT
jgi:hypothetical protein